ncbi:hypothetical protein FSP39_017022 [Pinctada imbricata]|uniref:Lipase domain-containing protein n=1 Tax=Pinctada imbricata TaxID=66713 RepID=A0AA88XVF9_PINIB|nr:hypothetical protein FSP39_017022 [Pinctada imbricata]
MKILIYFVIFSGLLGISISNRIRNKRSSQCWEHLGCFSNAPPYNNADGALPLSPEFIQTQFYLFASENQANPENLKDDDVRGLTRSQYDGNRKTVFIIHGFLQSGMVDWTITLANEILKKDQANVIIVDWGHGSGFPYTQAVANTRIVGAEVASLVTFLSEHAGPNLTRFHLIGHSLGSHICGYAGERLNGLGRITGLDPAEPNFKGYDVRVRLDPTDAAFVDVIHTDDTGYDTVSGYGLSDPVGHMDFYPNGGHNQPGCPHEDWMTIINEEYQVGTERTADLIACSHSRSIELFTESINSPCKFKSFPCDSALDFKMGRCFDCGNKPCPAMGFSANTYSSRGKFYLATTASSPFCGHQYLVDLKFGEGMPHSYGRIRITLLGSHGLTDAFFVDGHVNGFRPDQERHVMVVSHSDLGDIAQVQIAFEEHRSMFWWGAAGHVSIHHVMVKLEGQNRPIYALLPPVFKGLNTTFKELLILTGQKAIHYKNDIIIGLKQGMSQSSFQGTDTNGAPSGIKIEVSIDEAIMTLGRKNDGTMKDVITHGWSGWWWRSNCYEDLGEFKTDPPFNNTGGWEPQCIRHISTTFQLFTKGQTTSPQLLDLADSTTITNSHYDGSLKTVFIVHGYRDSASSQWVKDMVAALLKEILRGPCFEEQDVIVRLDPDDAKYVDVIHTDGDSLLALGFGCDRPLGDADFYPNGGVDQPGCPTHIKDHLFSIITGQISELTDGVGCSHLRALDLFTESITSSCKFQSVPCSSKSKYDNNQCTQCGHGCADMGYYSSPLSRGSFFLTTSDGSNGSPYCKA